MSPNSDDAIERRIAEVLTRDRSSGLCPLDGPCASCDCFDPQHEYDRANAKAVMAEVVTPELGRLRNRITALEANGSELLARAERAEAEEERMRATPVDWDAQRRRADGLEAERDALNAALAALSANWMRRAGNITGANKGETFPDLLAIRRARAGVLRDCTRDLRDALRVPESNADAPTPVSAATEAHGETTEAQEGSR